jgi:flagellar biogenesis protein FliO
MKFSGLMLNQMPGLMRGVALASLSLTAPYKALAELPVSSSNVAATATLAAEPSMASSTLTMVAGLCFCLGVFALGMRISKRFMKSAGASRKRRMEIRERLSLSSKTTLFLVAVDNREYLIANGSDAVSVTPTNSMTTPLFSESLDEFCGDSKELHA